MVGKKYLFFLIVLPLLLQFVTVPLLGDINKVGKLFVFALSVIVFAFFFFKSKSTLKVSPVLMVFGLIWLSFFLLARFSISPPWAYLHVAMLALGLVFALLVSHVSARSEHFFRLFVAALLIAGVLASALGLYEYFHFSFLGSSRRMLIPYLLPPDLGPRVVGLYGQPNLFAVFLTSTVLAFFYHYVHRDDFSTERHTSFLRFVPFLLVSLVFFQTGSRAGLLSIVLILGFLSWLVARGKYLDSEPQRKKEFISLLICFCVAFVASRLLAQYFIQDVSSLTDVGVSSDARFIYWTTAVLIFLDNPWTGIGLDNYRFLQNSYNLEAHDLLGFVEYERMSNTNWAHSEILQLLCEGGVLVFIPVFLLLLLLVYVSSKHFIRTESRIDPQFLYSHIFLFPFIIQSFFSWPFRYPSLLILFFAFLAILVAQYRLFELKISLFVSVLIRFSLVICFCLAFVLLYYEFKIGEFNKSFTDVESIEQTIPLFDDLVDNAYSRYRVLHGGTPYYVHEALLREDNALATWILPYCEQLTVLEGARWQWFNLTKIYLKLGHEADARKAILKTIDLMPSDDMTWSVLHYLNMLQAARETGRPLEYFWPNGHAFDLYDMELIHD